MIISHKHKCIFIKTEKTAGTSIEIALSKYCGPDDVITPILPDDEEMRNNLGYRGPQNYLIPFNKYTNLDWLNLIFKRKRLAFFNHASAAYIMKYLDWDVWSSYFKFSFERNPWDKVVSWYYWRYLDEPRPDISEFVQSREANYIRGFELYSIRGELVVDKVYRFEQLKDSLADIAARVGLPEVPNLPKSKTNHRKDKRHYREILSDDDKEKIGKVYARSIAFFNYEW